jgi:hypothetical protein
VPGGASLAADLPAAVLADLTGISVSTAERWSHWAKRDIDRRATTLRSRSEAANYVRLSSFRAADLTHPSRSAELMQRPATAAFVQRAG